MSALDLIEQAAVYSGLGTCESMAVVRIFASAGDGVDQNGHIRKAINLLELAIADRGTPPAPTASAPPKEQVSPKDDGCYRTCTECGEKKGRPAFLAGEHVCRKCQNAKKAPGRKTPTAREKAEQALEKLAIKWATDHDLVFADDEERAEFIEDFKDGNQDQWA